jgi:hypothetical protein
MSLLNRVKNRVKKKIESFSGEYSQEAPEDRPDYARPGVQNNEAEVQMAIIHGINGRKNMYTKDREKTYNQKSSVIGKKDSPKES